MAEAVLKNPSPQNTPQRSNPDTTTALALTFVPYSPAVKTVQADGIMRRRCLSPAHKIKKLSKSGASSSTPVRLGRFCGNSGLSGSRFLCLLSFGETKESE
jgi:hypothetical protein